MKTNIMQLTQNAGHGLARGMGMAAHRPEKLHGSYTDRKCGLLGTCGNVATSYDCRSETPVDLLECRRVYEDRVTL